MTNQKVIRIPKVLLTYFKHIQYMLNNPGVPGLDAIREEIHDEVCAYYGISKEQSKIITDDLFSYNGITAHDALRKIAEHQHKNEQAPN